MKYIEFFFLKNHQIKSTSTGKATLKKLFNIFFQRGPVVRIEELIEKKLYEDITPEIFDGIVTDIHELLNDSLSRFKETKEFKNFGQSKSRSTFSSPRGGSDSSEKSFKIDKSQCSSISSNISSPISSVGSYHSVLEMDLNISKESVDSPL